MSLVALAALGLAGCGLHLGRAPVGVDSVSLGVVEVGVPEPRLQEDLARALAAELATRTRVGSGPAVSARVVTSHVGPVGAEGHTWEARLRVRYRLETQPPVEREVSGERLFSGTPESWDTTSAARSDALRSLVEQLTAEAVPALLAGAA